jgi:hypothetical protein
VQYSAESIFVVEYKYILETALAHESVHPGELFDKKTRGRISRETVPLINYSKWLVILKKANERVKY